MSRIGRMPVVIPQGVKVICAPGVVRVEGPAGKLEMKLPSGIQIRIDAHQALVEKPAGDSAWYRALHGTIRAKLANMVAGVLKPFQKTLEISGVGYRATVTGQKIQMTLGYSKPVEVELPQGINAVVDKQTVVTLSSPDLELLGKVAASLRSMRPPDVYQGKGIRYQGEHLIHKPGKAAVGTTTGAPAGGGAKK